MNQVSLRTGQAIELSRDEADFLLQCARVAIDLVEDWEYEIRTGDTKGVVLELCSQLEAIVRKADGADG